MALSRQTDLVKPHEGDPLDNPNGFRLSLVAPETDYEIFGVEMQVLNLTLKPGDGVEASPGAMMHHGPNIYAVPSCSFSCGRLCNGESNVKMHYQNKGDEPEVIGLTPNFPAKIVPLHLVDEGPIIARSQAYMCGVGNVDVGLSCDCNPCTCCCGGMGFFREKITGDGVVFLQAGGTVLEKTLQPGEGMIVDQESLVAWSVDVSFAVKPFGGICGCCTCCFGGEGCCMALLTGPGKVIITSMNFAKWYRVLAPSPQGRNQQQGGNRAENAAA